MDEDYDYRFVRFSEVSEMLRNGWMPVPFVPASNNRVFLRKKKERK